MKTVYLDTISINKLYDQLNRKFKYSRLQKYNFAISSCQTDELGCIESPMRRSQLTEFIFKISDKRELKDHIEIMSSETLFEIGARDTIEYIDPDYLNYDGMVKGIIKNRLPDDFYKDAINSMGNAKKTYKDGRKEMRSLQPIFNSLEEIGLKKSFEEIFIEMIEEGLINNFLFETLQYESEYLGFNFDNYKEDILNMDLSKLKCSYVGLQGKFAYDYLSSFEKGKISKLKASDQVDVRHLYYLNYADVFVTDDEKIQTIYNMIFGITSKIESTDSFINNYL